MTHAYQAVSWNRQKRLYDATIAAGVVLYVGIFAGLGALLNPNATAETLVIRGLGTCAFLMLHVALSIGPLCRLDSRFLPFLYNRRHLGVATFLVGLAHGAFSIVQFHALGDTNPLVSVLASNTRFESVSQFPFQQLGLVALTIMFVMAATSHDFWLANLSAPAWKRIHMLVYAAYALLVAHVTLGSLQSERGVAIAGVVALGAATVIGLHVAAAIKEARFDDRRLAPCERGLVDVCHVDEIPEGRAHVAMAGDERVAVFRYDGLVSALSNVCRHQNGPLGEGKIVDGCVTCPWHGFQYEPANGSAPAPFTEKVSTYAVEIVDGRVWVDPAPHPPGTYVEPARIESGRATSA